MRLDRPLNVLFLCTGNSARSIMAESILRREGGGLVHAWSAGSHPTGRVNLHAIDLLRERGYPVDALRSKSWDEFAGDAAPHFDIVITVCDAAAGEACPLWPGRPVTAHWGVPDPAAVEGSEADKRAAFARAFDVLAARIRAFLALPVAQLPRESLTHALREIAA
jgi:arsenate reductase